MYLPLRSGTVVSWTTDQKSGLAIFVVYLGSRIMRLIMLKIGKNYQSKFWIPGRYQKSIRVNDPQNIGAPQNIGLSTRYNIKQSKH